MPLYLNNKRNVLFIHIPKTGGTTIENWLYKTGDFKQLLFSEHILKDTRVTGQHFGFETLENLIGDLNTKDLYKFAIVRNPYDRLISEFFYRVKIKDLTLGEKPEKYFSSWVDCTFKMYKNDNSILDNHLRPQSYFVSDDVVCFKLENGIENAISQVAQELQLEKAKSIESKKVGEKKEVVWSKSALDKVHELYECDFKNFEYQKRVENEDIQASSIKEIKYSFEYYLKGKKRLTKWLNL